LLENSVPSIENIQAAPTWSRWRRLENMTITSDTPVGHVAAEYPLATRVFHRHNIDFCCGGGASLAAACERRGVDPAEIIVEIEKELQVSSEPAKRWDEATVDELIDHILEAFHRPLTEELRRLHVLGRKVLTVHGAGTPVLEELFTIYTGLQLELEKHMASEEVAFPLFREGRAPDVAKDIEGMEREHTDAGNALAQIRKLTNDYEVPEGACNSWRALWHGLAQLEVELHEHIHLENNILFPRVLGH